MMNANQFSRRFPRKKFLRPVAVVCKGVSAVFRGVEIGEGGVSFESDLAFNTNDQIVINFYIPQGGFFLVRATVKNQIAPDVVETNLSNQPMSQLPVYGVSFAEVSLALKRQIRSFVARSEEQKQKA